MKDHQFINMPISCDDGQVEKRRGEIVPSKSRRWTEFEGLRGLLSWWVVVNHILQEAGYSEGTLGRGARLLLHGDYAVNVFIMLSGMVIYKLWCDRREPYRLFILRRLLRLWPAYFICLLIALVLRPIIIGNTMDPPIGDNQLAARIYAAMINENAFLGRHVLAHLFMVHGAVPETLLPGAAMSILGPPWSVSLEWQFYLVAPFLFLLLQRGGSVAWITFSSLAGVAWMCRSSAPLIVWFPMGSFLGQQLLFFSVGMVSVRILDALSGYKEQIVGPLFGLATMSLFFTLWLPFAIWLVTLACCVAERNPLKKMLNCLPIQFLGRISYSTYLGHMIVLYPLKALVIKVIPDVSSPHMLLTLLVCGVPLIVLLSFALYRWVEAPAIAFGKRLR